MNRVVCHFSCGAASAVATKLALAQYGHDRVVIFNAFVAEEHPDNRRFAADCEKWFDHPVTVLRDEKYGASAREVWRRRRFIKQRLGSQCSIVLKRELIDAHSAHDDLHVYGFTVEEIDRAERFRSAGLVCPLIDRSLTKADCLGIVERAGIELPLMYRMGYNNANCIGCCKGGMGYWNKIRRDFPEDFAAAAKIEADIGPSSYMLFNRETGDRFPLTQLDPSAGRHDETVPDCSIFCAMAEQDMASA